MKEHIGISKQKKHTNEIEIVHCKNKIVKMTNFLVSTVARNSGNCNLIGCVGCYAWIYM